MKIVIFAGGTGRRLWPISRTESPKQFEPIIDSRSTVQLAVERVVDTYGAHNTFVSTNKRYLSILGQQLPSLPQANFICEPTRQDLAAAVGLASMHMLHRYGPTEPMAIIWGDNFVTEQSTFLDLLARAEWLTSTRRARIVFIGETARFANNNLGWIRLGEQKGEVAGRPYFAFDSWAYRPSLEKCRDMFASGNYIWNTGYFVTTPGFVREAYRAFQPNMWSQLQQIGQVIDRYEYQATLDALYPTLEVASFDDAVVQHISPSEALVLHGAMGWSDPGTLYALKESISPAADTNVTRGLVKAHSSEDCLLYNYDNGKLLAVAGLEGMIVVNTPDAILVVHKDNVSQVKQLVNDLAAGGLEAYT